MNNVFYFSVLSIWSGAIITNIGDEKWSEWGEKDLINTNKFVLKYEHISRAMHAVLFQQLFSVEIVFFFWIILKNASFFIFESFYCFCFSSFNCHKFLEMKISNRFFENRVRSRPARWKFSGLARQHLIKTWLIQSPATSARVNVSGANVWMLRCENQAYRLNMLSSIRR